MLRDCVLASVLALVVSLPAFAADPVQEVVDCMNRNVPKRSSSQMVRFRAFDRLGGESSCRGKLIVARDDRKLGHMKVCMEEPVDMRGTHYLSFESPGNPP